MTEPYPPELVCPISQDLMNDPVTVTHMGQEYNFDRVGLETWKTTPGGDQNPLTMLTGFREAPLKSSEEIKRKVREYRERNGMKIDVESEKTDLEPFSDYQQIQDDEQEALRLHRELNGPPPPREYRINLRWDTPEGIVERTVSVPAMYSMLLEIAPPDMRNRVLDLIIDDLMRMYMDVVPDAPVYGPEIPEGGLPVPEDTSNNFGGFRSGFLN